MTAGRKPVVEESYSKFKKNNRMKNIAPTDKTDDLELSSAKVEYLDELDLLVFQLQVRGEAGGTIPQAHGGLAGAPGRGYVFPTTLDPGAVGVTNARSE